jgi:hypothetical protein
MIISCDSLPLMAGFSDQHATAGNRPSPGLRGTASLPDLGHKVPTSVMDTCYEIALKLGRLEASDREPKGQHLFWGYLLARRVRGGSG